LVAPVFGNPVQLGIYEADQTLTLCEGAGAARLALTLVKTRAQIANLKSKILHPV